MAIELFNNGSHVCMMFEDLVDDSSDAVQANQFLIASDGHLAVLDPGGNMTYNGIYMAKHRHFAGMNVKNLECGVDLMTQEHYVAP